MSEIKAAIEGARAYLSSHPDEARYIDSEARAELIDGLRTRVTGAGGEELLTDMSAGIGGTGSAPSPGWLFRAAMASCAATLVAMRAAELGVSLDRLEVRATSESDDRGILGIDEDVPAGPLSVRLEVDAVASGTEPAELERLARWAIEHCPVVEALGRSVMTEIEVRSPAPGM